MIRKNHLKRSSFIVVDNTNKKKYKEYHYKNLFNKPRFYKFQVIRKMKEYTEIDLKSISKHTLLIARGRSKNVKVAGSDLQFTQISHF